MIGLGKYLNGARQLALLENIKHLVSDLNSFANLASKGAHHCYSYNAKYKRFSVKNSNFQRSCVAQLL